MLDKLNKTVIDADLLDEITENLRATAAYVRAAHSALAFSGGDIPAPDYKVASAKGPECVGAIYWSDLEKSRELYERLTNP
jgi:hypothetical protein